MQRPLTKEALKAELLTMVEDDLRALERAHRSTTEGATHPEAKVENSKDTRALEQTYLARGQALRADELRVGLAMVRTLSTADLSGGAVACSGALVTLVGLADGDEERVVWLAPFGGGYRLASGTIAVVTPQSPLGRGILGKATGEECEVTLGGKRRSVEIVGVQ